MDFTIIIPTFNSEKYIFDCLRSIFEMHYSQNQFEVIVVDGGSSDNTLEIISGFEKVKLVHSLNISISNSRNVGASQSTGENLVFIDSDCIVDQYLLKKAKDYLQRYTCYGSFYKAYEKHGWIAKTWLIVEQKPDGNVKWIPSGTLAVSRKAFTDINGFNEALQVEEDEDFCHRIRSKGGVIFNDSSIASIHLGQADTIKHFFQKEAWRGRSLVKPIKGYLDNKLSPFDILIFFYLLLLVTFCVSLLIGKLWLTYSIIALLIIIPALLSVRISLRTGHLERIAQIFFLHIIFLVSRSWSVIKYNQYQQLFIKENS